MKYVSQPDVNKYCLSCDWMETNSPVISFCSFRHCVVIVVICVHKMNIILQVHERHFDIFKDHFFVKFVLLHTVNLRK